jgi:hypothetical protein
VAVPDLPRTVVASDQNKGLEATRVDAAISHLRLERVRRYDICGPFIDHLDLTIAVAELQIL